MQSPTDCPATLSSCRASAPQGLEWHECLQLTRLSLGPLVLPPPRTFAEELLREFEVASLQPGRRVSGVHGLGRTQRLQAPSATCSPPKLPSFIPQEHPGAG